MNEVEQPEDALRSRLRAALDGVAEDAPMVRAVKPTQRSGGVAGLAAVDAKVTALGWRGSVFDRVNEPDREDSRPSRQELVPHADGPFSPWSPQLHLPSGQRDPAVVREFWRRAFAIDRAGFDDLHPYRVRVAWRVVREMSRLLSVCNDDQLLTDGLVTEPDPWVDGVDGWKPNRRDNYVSRRWEAVLLLTGQNCRPGDDGRALPLLPPGFPAGWIVDGHLDDRYDPADPAHDPALHRWLDVFGKILKYLGVEHGSEKDREQGLFGTYGLDDPWTVRTLFPSRIEIAAIEELLVEETIQRYVSAGGASARKYLFVVYGLNDRETECLIRCARARVRVSHTATPEENRAFMVARLEDFIRRCRKTVIPDRRSELMALKALAVVQGIGQVEPEDADKEFFDMTKKREGAPAPRRIDLKPGEFDVRPAGGVPGVH